MEADSRVVQVTNIAPQATKDQMVTLFSFLGKIEDLRLYPTMRDASINIQSRVCFIKFQVNYWMTIQSSMSTNRKMNRETAKICCLSLWCSHYLVENGFK